MFSELTIENGKVVEKEISADIDTYVIPKIPKIGQASEPLPEMVGVQLVPKKRPGRPRKSKDKNKEPSKVLRRSYLKTDRFKTVENKVLKLEHNQLILTNQVQQNQLKMNLMSRAIKDVTQTLRELMKLPIPQK